MLDLVTPSSRVMCLCVQPRNLRPLWFTGFQKHKDNKNARVECHDNIESCMNSKHIECAAKTVWLRKNKITCLNNFVLVIVVVKKLIRDWTLWKLSFKIACHRKRISSLGGLRGLTEHTIRTIDQTIDKASRSRHDHPSPSYHPLIHRSPVGPITKCDAPVSGFSSPHLPYICYFETSRKRKQLKESTCVYQTRGHEQVLQV